VAWAVERKLVVALDGGLTPLATAAPDVLHGFEVELRSRAQNPHAWPWKYRPSFRRALRAIRMGKFRTPDARCRETRAVPHHIGGGKFTICQWMAVTS
jgi:hypothetical protein